MINIFLNILAFGTLLSSLLVITDKNPVIAVIFLISVFINAAGYLMLLGVGFLGITYIILYVGAITVLFLFVIMMINIKLTDILETGSQYTKNLPLAFAIGLLFIYELFSNKMWKKVVLFKCFQQLVWSYHEEGLPVSNTIIYIYKGEKCKFKRESSGESYLEESFFF